MRLRLLGLLMLHLSLLLSCTARRAIFSREGGREAEVMTHECLEMRRRRAEDGAPRIMGSSLNLHQHR